MLSWHVASSISFSRIAIFMIMSVAGSSPVVIVLPCDAVSAASRALCWAPHALAKRLCCASCLNMRAACLTTISFECDGDCLPVHQLIADIMPMCHSDVVCNFLPCSSHLICRFLLSMIEHMVAEGAAQSNKSSCYGRLIDYSIEVRWR